MTKGNRVECSTCHKTFSTMRHLTRHLKIHAKDRKFGCSICPIRFIEKGQLKRHLISVHNMKSLNVEPQKMWVSRVAKKCYKWPQCVFCFKEIPLVTHLHIQLRSHTQENPFVCGTCDKGFSTFYNLNMRKRIHANRRDFNCELCGAKFNHPSHLSQHVRTHTGERPFLENCHLKDHHSKQH